MSNVAARSAILSKGKFADLIGVSPARVSQYITLQLIDSSALVGTGRGAMVLVEEAKRQLRQRRDPGQALSNGLKTRLEPDPPPSGRDWSDDPSQTVNGEVALMMIADAMTATLRDAFDLPEDAAKRVVAACLHQGFDLTELWELKNGRADGAAQP